MKKVTLILIGLMSFGFNTLVFAEAAAHEGAEKAIEVKPFGDVEAGKKKAASCTGCHGRNGDSLISINPKLAGQGAKYLFKQMNDFKTGERPNALMQSQLAGKSEQDLKDIAAFFAEQKSSSGLVKKEFMELGQKIYRGGNAETGLPACIACHGPAGEGMSAAGFPSLAGQHAQYVEAQLKAFRSAGRGDHSGQKRTNDSVDGGPAMMQDVSAKMSDDEIQAVSSYISGLR